MPWKEPPSLRTCPICGIEFESSEERNRHTRNEHPEFSRESGRLAIALIPLMILGGALGILAVHFNSINPNLSWTILDLMWVELAGIAYVGYRIYRLPQKYKRLYEQRKTESPQQT